MDLRKSAELLPVVHGMNFAVSAAISASYLNGYNIVTERRPRKAYPNGSAALDNPLGNWSDQTGAYH